MAGSRRYLGTFLSYAAMTLGAIIFVGPLLWVISTSLMGPDQNPFLIPPQLIPHPATFANYQSVFKTWPFGDYLLNSLELAILSVAGTGIISTLTAYPLARMDFAGKKIVFALVIATLVLPGEAVLVPRYLLVNLFGMVNSFWGVAVPGFFSGFGVFLLRQAYLTLPKELEDAARIDGAGELRIFGQVMTPLIMPSLAALAIFTFLGSWDAFLWPLIILNSQKMYTAPLGLAYFFGYFGASWQLIAAASIIVILPVIIVFVSLQRLFINGVTGAVKG